MNGRTTQFLVALALILFAYIFFFERHTMDTDTRRARAHVLLPDFDPETVTRLEVVRGRETIDVERAGSQWRMTAPVAYPAQTIKIDNLVKALKKIAPEAVIAPSEIAKEPGGLKAYGLLKPETSLVIVQPGRQQTLRIGGRTLGGDQIYLQLAGTNNVYVADAAFLKHLPASADDWRDRSLVDLRGMEFNQIDVQTGNRAFEVRREPATHLWRLTQPRPARADNNQLVFLLEQLQNLHVVQFVADTPLTDLDKFGLSSPQVDLSLSQDTNKIFEIQFGASPTNDPKDVYALSFAHTNVVVVPKTISDMLQSPLTRFLDHHLVSFPPKSISRIQVDANEHFQLQRKPNGAWRVTQPTAFPADATLVHHFLMCLNALEIQDFVKDVVTDFSAYGLAKPARRYTLDTFAGPNTSPTNKLLVQIDFGGLKHNLVFARRSDENSVYAVSALDLDLLPVAAFQLRDRSIWNFDQTNVATVTIRQSGKTKNLTRNKKGLWQEGTNVLGLVERASLDETLHRLGHLHALQWVGQGDKSLALYGFPQADHQVTLHVKQGKSAKNYSIAFGRLSPENHPYASVRLDGRRLIFEFPQGLYQDVLRDLAIKPPPDSP